MDARWYAPSSGQYDSVDTMHNSAVPNPITANPFAYGNVRPLKPNLGD